MRRVGALVSHLAVSVFACMALASAAGAQEEAYAYALDGRYGTMGPRFDSTLTLERRVDGRYDATRSWRYRELGEVAPRLTGVADIKIHRERYNHNGRTRFRSVVVIKALFSEKAGATAALSQLSGGSSAEVTTYSATYQVRGRDARGLVSVRGRDGKVKRVYESGYSTADPIEYGDMGDESEVATSDEVSPEVSPEVGPPEPEPESKLTHALRILSPKSGSVFLAGSRTAVSRKRSRGEVEVVSGPAELKHGQVVFTGAGEVRIQLRRGDQISYPVDLEVVQPEIVAITVEEAIALDDAKPPHFSRELGGEAKDDVTEPSVILTGTQLRLKVTLKAAKDLTRPVAVRFSAEDGEVELYGEANLRGLKAGQEVEFVSVEGLAEGVQVNQLNLSWRLEAATKLSLDGKTPLRIYTTYSDPVDNPLPRYGPEERQGQPLRTKLHFELACTWAQGATRNIGRGADSIGHRIDNAMRHLVHWKDYGTDGQYTPVIPHYPKDAPVPLNYHKLPSGSWSVGQVSSGRRGVASLFYPSERKTGDLYNYDNYKHNFGWYVLENPKYPGGRCNQQASLICDIVGTVGLKAEVYYIERTAISRKSKRPIRRYYMSNISGKTWNFHGQAKVMMADGTPWLYDGSGSSPPTRTNGPEAVLMKIGGSYVRWWEPWIYDDDDKHTFVKLEEWPDEGKWRGVPIQPGEKPLVRDAPDGTYAYPIGKGTMESGKVLQFFIVNIGGRFVTKVGAGTLEAHDYTIAEHGKIANWQGNR
jgi:hypothetical protein